MMDALDRSDPEQAAGKITELLPNLAVGGRSVKTLFGSGLLSFDICETHKVNTNTISPFRTGNIKHLVLTGNLNKSRETDES